MPMIAVMQSPLRMHRGGRALTEDAEGPRMSMAMRRQLGIAPTKSPSKASSAAACERSCISSAINGLPSLLHGTREYELYAACGECYYPAAKNPNYA